MNISIFRRAAIGALLVAASFGASAQAVLAGLEKLSCEAILCLATSQRPYECSTAVNHYRSIKHKKLKDTINARRKFLAICPKGPTTAALEELLDSQSAAEQFCDAEFLNRLSDPRLSLLEGGVDFRLEDRGCGTGMWCLGEIPPQIPDALPATCAALANNPLTYDVAPRYVGTPALRGFWVDSNNYAVANAYYQANLPGIIAQVEYWNTLGQNSSRGGEGH